jgi:hypothetical protein
MRFGPVWHRGARPHEHVRESPGVIELARDQHALDRPQIVEVLAHVVTDTATLGRVTVTTCLAASERCDERDTQTPHASVGCIVCSS